MRRRGNVFAIALAVAAVLAGCGGGDQEQSVRALIEDTNTEGAEATVEAFFRAGNQRDAKAICALLTADQAQAFGQATGGDCESGMKAVFEEEDPPRTKVIIEDVRVSGERATVDATITQGGETRPSSLDLIQEGGEWKLVDPGV
jgi:hypothetical protein